MSGGRNIGHVAVLVEGADGVTCATCGGPGAMYAGKPSHRRGRWREAGVAGPRKPRSDRQRTHVPRPAAVVAIAGGRVDLSINQGALTVLTVLRLAGRRAIALDLSLREARMLAHRLNQAVDAVVTVAS